MPTPNRKPLPLAGKSCIGCPSNLETGQQGAVIGRSIGGPICGSRNIPLARPGVNNQKKMAEHFAKGCNMHGVDVDFEAPDSKRAITIQVAMPDPTVRESDNWQAEPVASCTGCANYVPPRVVQQLTGWRSGLCRASGSLLLDDRLTSYSSECASRVYVKPEDRINELSPNLTGMKLHLLPEYAEDFGQPKKIDPRKIHEVNVNLIPGTYNSDAPVKEAHTRMGIKAFRRVEDPKGYGAPILVPIMNEEGTRFIGKDEVPLFTDEERSRIPRTDGPGKPNKHFDHNGAAYRMFTMWLRLNMTPAIWGIAGTGKTEMFRHLAWMMVMPFQRISITETSDNEDLFGKMLYSKEKGTYYQYGRVPKAWARPNVLTLDEPNTGPAAVWQKIRPLTDDSSQLILDENAAEAVSKDRLCFFGMAMNPAWDPRNTGAFPLADADGSRLMHIEMPLPPEHIETEILLDVAKDDKWDEATARRSVATLMRIAKEIRGLSDSGALPVTWGIRPQKKVLRIHRYASWEDSFRMGVVDALEPEIRDLVLNVVRSHDDESD